MGIEQAQEEIVAKLNSEYPEDRLEIRFVLGKEGKAYYLNGDPIRAKWYSDKEVLVTISANISLECYSEILIGAIERSLIVEILTSKIGYDKALHRVYGSNFQDKDYSTVPLKPLT